MTILTFVGEIVKMFGNKNQMFGNNLQNIYDCNDYALRGSFQKCLDPLHDSFWSILLQKVTAILKLMCYRMWIRFLPATQTYCPAARPLHPPHKPNETS